MPTLQPHIGGQSYRTTQRPANTDISGATRGLISTVRGVIQRSNELDRNLQIAEDQNKLDAAVLGTKNDLLLQNAKQAKNPTAEDEGWHEEQTTEIVDTHSEQVPPHLQFAFKEKTQLAVTASNIKAGINRGIAVRKEGVAILDQNLLGVAGVPQQFREQEISELLMGAGAKGIINAKDANIRRTAAWSNAARVDASGFNDKGEPMFDEVMAKVADLTDPTYPLKSDEREILWSKLKKQKNMVTADRSNKATGAFLDIVADKMAKNIPLTVSDAEQFKNIVSSKERDGFLKIVKQSQATERTVTRFDQTQLDYYRGEADRLLETISVSPELQEQVKDGLIDPDVIRGSKTIPEKEKKGLITVAKELKRLQKIEEFETDTELAVGGLDANLDKYSRDSLLIKLATDPHLKTLNSPAKQAIIEKHKQVVSKGQSFRSKKDWQTAYRNMIEFRDNLGFVGGVPDTTDQAVMDKAVLQNKQEFAKAERAFLDRSEFSSRDYSKNPNQPAPDYNSFSEYEMQPYRVKQEEDMVVQFIKDVFTTPTTKYMEGKEQRIEEQQLEASRTAFETSPETQEFEAYMAEKEQIARGLTDKVVGKVDKQDEFEIGEIQFDHKYVGNGQWQPLN
jgi:hypothetical protein